ncbi:hypothetical protein Vi05172_g12282 [Venturia inaequalis]|nr:hypothetical protein Vi05172_g12282 [Venturia inaequalis]
MHSPGKAFVDGMSEERAAFTTLLGGRANCLEWALDASAADGLEMTTVRTQSVFRLTSRPPSEQGDEIRHAHMRPERA